MNVTCAACGSSDSCGTQPTDNYYNLEQGEREIELEHTLVLALECCHHGHNQPSNNQLYINLTQMKVVLSGRLNAAVEQISLSHLVQLPVKVLLWQFVVHFHFAAKLNYQNIPIYLFFAV